MIKYNSNNINQWYDGSTLIHKAMYNGRRIYQRVSNNPIPSTYKAFVEYNDATTKTIECDGSSTLTLNNTVLGDMFSVNNLYISNCVEEIGGSPIGTYSSVRLCDMSDSRITTLPSSFFTETLAHHLKEVVFPNTLTSIANSAFFNCTMLSAATLPSSITSIDDSAFYGCVSLQRLVLPSSLTNIQGGIYQNCSGATEVVIEDGVTNIPDYTFSGCIGLTEANIPSSILYIGDSAFSSCSSLSRITVHGLTPPALGTNVFQYTNNCDIFVPSESLELYKNEWAEYAERLKAIE